MSQFIWFNKYIKIDNSSVYIKYFSNKNLNFVGELFETDGKIKPWEKIKTLYNLPNNMEFCWMQIVHALPKSWKKEILENKGNSNNLVIYDHHLIKKSQVYSLNRLDSKELYNILITSIYSKPTSQLYYENSFETLFEWKNIYLLPRKITLDTTLRVFQYKILNNILYLNKMLFRFEKVSSPLCSFCKAEEETATHLFYYCHLTQSLWNQLRGVFVNKLDIPLTTPQSAIFGFLDIKNENYLIINHLLLIYKFYLYKARDSGKLSFNSLRSNIIKTQEN